MQSCCTTYSYIRHQSRSRQTVRSRRSDPAIPAHAYKRPYRDQTISASCRLGLACMIATLDKEARGRSRHTLLYAVTATIPLRCILLLLPARHKTNGIVVNMFVSTPCSNGRCKTHNAHAIIAFTDREGHAPPAAPSPSASVRSSSTVDKEL